jgi:hypothetical protein
MQFSSFSDIWAHRSASFSKFLTDIHVNFKKRLGSYMQQKKPTVYSLVSFAVSASIFKYYALSPSLCLLSGTFAMRLLAFHEICCWGITLVDCLHKELHWVCTFLERNSPNICW